MSASNSYAKQSSDTSVNYSLSETQNTASGAGSTAVAQHGGSKNTQINVSDGGAVSQSAIASNDDVSKAAIAANADTSKSAMATMLASQNSSLDFSKTMGVSSVTNMQSIAAQSIAAQGGTTNQALQLLGSTIAQQTDSNTRVLSDNNARVAAALASTQDLAANVQSNGGTIAAKTTNLTIVGVIALGIVAVLAWVFKKGKATV